LLDAHAEYNNTAYRQLIANPDEWQATIDVLLNGSYVMSSCRSGWQSESMWANGMLQSWLQQHLELRTQDRCYRGCAVYGRSAG